MPQKNRMKLLAKKIIPKSGLNFIRKVILKRPRSKILKNLFEYVSEPIRNKKYLLMFEKTITSENNSEDQIYSIFKDSDDDFWFWLYTKGYLQLPKLRKIFPKLPAERIQQQFTGVSNYAALEEAFLFYKLVKQIIRQHGLIFSKESKILDFGCGWGRVIRFFLKEVPSKNLLGIDCDSEILKLCESSNFPCNFALTGVFPPTDLKDNSFDLIYSYSVFSHLSEDAHIEWVKEFSRILKPGGVLVVTTRDRDFILTCAKLRDASGEDVPFFSTGPAQSFIDTSKELALYDRGGYVYEPSGGGGIREGSFYGETCIPEKYVRKEWAQYFTELDFIDYKKHGQFNQNAVIAIK